MSVEDDAFLYTPDHGFLGFDHFVFVGTGWNGKAIIKTITVEVAWTLPATGAYDINTMMAISGGGLLLWSLGRHRMRAASGRTTDGTRT